MKKYIVLLLMLTALVSCEKKAEYNRTLGLLSEYNKLSSAGGYTDVAVFSNTNWTLELDRPASWASVDRFEGYKSGPVVFTYEKNFGRARRVILIFRAGDQMMTQNMYQEGGIADSDVIMKVEEPEIISPAEGMIKELPFETNLVYSLDEMYLTVTYPEGETPESDWIRLVQVTRSNIIVKVDPNTTGNIRTANVRITHTDAGALKATEGDTLYSNVIKVEQGIE